MTTMSLGPVPLVDHSAPQLSGATTEIVTVSALLSMPAVWTSVVDRALPAGVVLERFVILLLSCALLAELVRRLGEGGALSHALAQPIPAADPVAKPVLVEADQAAVLDAVAPLSLDAPAAPTDLGDLGDFDLAPLDLDADPFADPA